MVVHNRNFSKNVRSARHSCSQRASEQHLVKLPKQKLQTPAIKAAQGMKMQLEKVNVACDFCRKRKIRCKPLLAGSPVDPNNPTCEPCVMRGVMCSGRHNLIAGSIESPYQQPGALADLPMSYPEAPGAFDWYLNSSYQPYESAMSQCPSLAGLSPSSSATFRGDLHVPLRPLEARSSSVLADEQAGSNKYAPESLPMGQDGTYWYDIGLGVHVPDNHPRYTDVAESSSSPIPPRLAEVREFRVRIEH